MNRRGGADLHVHTTHSDGVCSPGEVVRAAANVGLDALAITDHDSVSALAVARPEADRLGIELINGVEWTTEHDGREVHLLGFGFDPSDPTIQATCDELRTRRAARFEALCDHLRSKNLQVDRGALRKSFPRATIGRRHLADWLVRTGQVADREAAFALHLGDANPVPKPRLPLIQAIAITRDAGGVAGLAHPPYDLSEPTLAAMVRLGLGAIEVDGPGVPKARGQRLRAWAGRMNLVPTAGTDFHAPDRPGRWVGAITCPRETLDQLHHSTQEPQATADHADSHG